MINLKIDEYYQFIIFLKIDTILMFNAHKYYIQTKSFCGAFELF